MTTAVTYIPTYKSMTAHNANSLGLVFLTTEL